MFRSKYSFNVRKVCFRKWGNKSYSVFSSLKALVKVGALSAAYSLVIVPKSSTFAQVDTIRVEKNIEIDEVVISSPMAASTYSELLRTVVVITAEEFSQLPASNLQELLENLASVDIRQRGGHGVQADLMVRGGSFDQVLILLNGVNITDPQTGHHNLNIPIDLESIQRIELLQGPGARVYGPGTFSGAINIITSTKGKNFARVSATAGQYGLFKTSSSAALSEKNVNIFLAASTMKSDGYTENTDFSIYNLFGHTTATLKMGTFDFQAGYQDKAFGAQSFYTPRFPEQFEETSTLFSSLSLNSKFNNISISPTVYVRTHNDRFELFRSQAPAWYRGHNYHNTLVYGGKLIFSSLNYFGRTRLGGEYRLEKILSNVLGEPLLIPKPIKGFADTTYTRGASRNLFNAFADHTFYLDRLTLSAGGLVSLSNSYGVNWNYGLDLSYRFWRDLSAIASYSNAIRFPTFTELYYSGPTNQGNVNLKPERANNFELGFKHIGSRVNSNITLFNRISEDVIDWVKKPDDEKWTTTNHTKINTSGLEAFVSIRTEEFITTIKSISLGYSYMNSDKQSDSLLSYYALDYLRQKATLGISHGITKNLSASWSAIWQERAGTYTEYPSNLEKPYKPFLVLNLRVNYGVKPFKAFVDVSNITDKVYFDLGNIPQAGRWISIGLSYTFD